MLGGINSETPLGYVVRIRSEKDSKIINKMTNNEKEIRRKWFEFRNKTTTKNKIIVSKENINDILTKLFK